MSRIGLVIFGATGFTGNRAVEQIIKISKVKERFTWGIAGRNSEKLQKLLEDVGKKYGVDLKDVPVIIADITDENSLNEMCKQAKVIVNCCGPYRFYGETVVKACVENKTHHVDVSAEAQFMETMQLKYHQKAKENGVYIVGACGNISIPADMGVAFLQKEFKGEVNTVESYFSMRIKDEEKGAMLHYGTWESVVYVFGHWFELWSIRKDLYPEKLPKFTPKPKRRFPIHKNELEKNWCVIFPEVDGPVVYRSQRHFFENENHRPVQFRPYFVLPNFTAAFLMSFMTIIFVIFSQFCLGRKLLLKYPKFFTLGYVSHEGPSEERAKNTEFTMTLYGEGWDEKSPKPTDQHASPPDKKIIVRVSGNDAAYGGTGAAAVLSGLAVLNESDKMPDQGGVYAPGAAFSKTKLVEDLSIFAFKFEVVSPIDQNVIEITHL